MMSARDSNTLVRVRNLSVRYNRAASDTFDRVSLSINRKEAVALLGDSGCGKTTLALAMMQLLPRNTIVGGSVRLHDNDHVEPIELMRMDADQLSRIRGNRVAMLLQNPKKSLNPVMRIGPQIEESVRLHVRVRRADARLRAMQLLSRVEIVDPERMARAWPHELSGGMAQRVGLAIALAGEPDLLIADEPTSALDLSAQGQVVELLRELRRETDLALLLITHDWTIARALADRVCVMDGHRIVEDRRPGEFDTAQIHSAARKLIDASNRRHNPTSENSGGVR